MIFTGICRSPLANYSPKLLVGIDKTGLTLAHCLDAVIITHAEVVLIEDGVAYICEDVESAGKGGSEQAISAYSVCRA